MSKTKAMKYIDDNLNNVSTRLRELEKLPQAIQNLPSYRADGKALSLLGLTLKELKDILSKGSDEE